MAIFNLFFNTQTEEDLVLEEEKDGPHGDDNNQLACSGRLDFIQWINMPFFLYPKLMIM